MRTRPRHRPTSAVTEFALLAAAEEAPAEALPTHARWAGPIGMEDELTGDGRMIAGGALRWEVSRDTPAALRFVRSDVGAHDGAEVVGSIDTIERRDGGVIWGEGDLYMDEEAGRDAYVAVRDKKQSGISMDLDDMSFEIRIAAELLEADGDLSGEVQEENEDGSVTVVTINSGDEVMLTTSARVRAATIVAVPAFINARIGITESDSEEEVEEPAEEVEVEDAIVAAAAPVRPPAGWFARRTLSGPTPLTVTADGQVYGHIALWGTCHISHTAGGNCVTPPNSPSGYALFHTGALETDDGSEVAVGHLTMSTGHAGQTLSAAQTASHYDNTGTVAADVRAYEDEFGIAVAGGLRPHLSAEQVREFRAAPVSGDWRRVGNALELVGALSVNVPGFGVPRPAGLVAGGHLTTLVASGMVARDSVAEDGLSITPADLRYLRTLQERERQDTARGYAARRNRIKVAAFARRNKKG